jgi:ABC-type transport system substrate-binding protein
MGKNDNLAKTLLSCIDTQFQKNQIDDGFEIGTITNIYPLTVEVDGLPLYKDNLYINKYLLEWDETVNIETSVNGNPSHNHIINTIHHPSKLQIGCLVTLYGLEWDSDGKTYQKYCLLNILN